MVNPTLAIDWPEHITTPGRWRRARCVCGARYRAFRTPGIPRDPKKRFGWAKRQLTKHDGDEDWYWRRRSLLWALHFLKALAFIEIHYCGGEDAARAAA